MVTSDILPSVLLRSGIAIAQLGRRFDVERLCALLGGIPLGMELAAGWADVLSPAEIAAEVDASIDFPESQTADRPDRHASLRAVFESSWRRLSEPERYALAG